MSSSLSLRKAQDWLWKPSSAHVSVGASMDVWWSGGQVLCLRLPRVPRQLAVNRVRTLCRTPGVSCMGFPWEWEPGQRSHRTGRGGRLELPVAASRIEY